VEDRSLVGVAQRPGELQRGPRRVARRERPLGVQPILERAPGEQVHDDVRAPRDLPGRTEPDEVRVLKLEQGAGLSQEPLPLIGGRLPPGQQELDRHLVPGLRLARPIHDPHSAPRQLAEHFVGADLHNARLVVQWQADQPRSAGASGRGGAELG